MIISGETHIAGESAPNGVQVVMLLEHPTLGKCWIAPVTTNNGRHSIVLSPPPDAASWLPPRYFVGGGVEATPSFALASFFPGQSWPVNLTVEESIDVAAESGEVVITEVDLTGSCPQRSASGSPPSLPVLVSGTVVINGAPAPEGTQVVAVMGHRTEGLCWHAPVPTNASSGFTVAVTPPAVTSGWFPVRIFVNGTEAEVEPVLGLSSYSPGASVNVTLNVSSN